MFVVRLLVGKYTKGSPEYRRPPSKDGGDINFYDSSVDNVRQPSIYVVFDKPQIYPEYLLQYRKKDFTFVLASGIGWQHEVSKDGGGCSFSHELNSEHNRRILGEHELDDLSREELCTLLMQSDDQMLPPICHDYNNGPGLFGRCQGGYGCRRVHICERSTYANIQAVKYHKGRLRSDRLHGDNPEQSF
ncbi:Poly [ADP-ribose] polymerase 12 [Takifugu flavidus]|uniref:Poly [ADP-ribose] polymerase 12 n=1 Tax=Takifugu flavidus TaxID=433684 RepID=A0A5C6NBC1_9TELE|nr:Poly [ADP-ribose] polymerase 12 [Takifugu flavidus]